MFVNAGLQFPACHADPDNGLLDLDKGAWHTVPFWEDVTCKHCRRLIRQAQRVFPSLTQKAEKELP
jgi:hypothetical protein